MKVPYSIQGAIFAPVVAILLFVLKVTCPVPAGSGCFADLFIPAVFLPLHADHLIQYSEFILRHEPFFILAYWIVVGYLVGYLFDLTQKHPRTKTETRR